MGDRGVTGSPSAFRCRHRLPRRSAAGLNRRRACGPASSVSVMVATSPPSGYFHRHGVPRPSRTPLRSSSTCAPALPSPRPAGQRRDPPASVEARMALLSACSDTGDLIDLRHSDGFLGHGRRGGGCRRDRGTGLGTTRRLSKTDARWARRSRLRPSAARSPPRRHPKAPRGVGRGPAACGRRRDRHDSARQLRAGSGLGRRSDPWSCSELPEATDQRHAGAHRDPEHRRGGPRSSPAKRRRRCERDGDEATQARAKT